MLRGLDPWRQLLLERENPRTLFGINQQHNGGHSLTRKQRIAANCCYCNQGGYMTLAELGVLFWHDLAAPIAVGIITSAILSWWRNRK